MDYKDKYIKYKTKYLELYNKIGGKRHINNGNRKYSISLKEPWFSLIMRGLKTVEGRKNKGIFQQMQVGDIVEWTNNNNNTSRSVKTRITGKAVYPSFREYLETEGLDKCLPGISEMDDGLSVYYKYFTKEEEKEYGVVAIRLKLVKK